MSPKTSNGVVDCGATFVIVPETKQVKVPPTHKIIGAVGDHLAEQITFECPKTIDGYDITKCMRKYITWQNVAGEIGHDELTVATGGKEGCVRLKWTIRGALTTAVGVVKFSVHFEDVTEDGETVRYRWSTAVCQNCEILDSINAILGTYAAIYVSGDTLVISDYTPVTDSTLSLEMAGIVPEGVLEITKEGVHDVGPYAQAKVQTTSGTLTITKNGLHDVTKYKKVNAVLDFETPTISVSETGKITAEANGVTAERQLTEADDPDLIPENITAGKTIFGVTGTADPRPRTIDVRVRTMGNETGATQWYTVYYTAPDPNDAAQVIYKEVVLNSDTPEQVLTVVNDSIIVLLHKTGGVRIGVTALDGAKEITHDVNGNLWTGWVSPTDVEATSLVVRFYNK